MKCPSCNKQPISKLHFSLNSFPSNINCINCDAELKPGKLLQGIIYGEYFLGAVLGFVLIILAGAMNWSYLITGVVFLLAVMILGLPIMYYGWMNGKYELVRKSNSS